MKLKGISTLIVLLALILIPCVAPAVTADATYYDEDKQVVFRNWGAAIHYYGYPTKYHKLLDKWLPSPVNDTGEPGYIYNITTEGYEVWFSEYNAGYWLNSSRSQGNMTLEFHSFGLWDSSDNDTDTIKLAIPDLPDNQIVMDSTGTKVTYQDVVTDNDISADVDFIPSTYRVSKDVMVKEFDKTHIMQTHGAGMNEATTYMETIFKVSGSDLFIINGQRWDGVNSTTTTGELRLRVDPYEYVVIPRPTAHWDSIGPIVSAQFRLWNNSGDIYLATQVKIPTFDTPGDWPLHIDPVVTQMTTVPYRADGVESTWGSSDVHVSLGNGLGMGLWNVSHETLTRVYDASTGYGYAFNGMRYWEADSSPGAEYVYWAGDEQPRILPFDRGIVYMNKTTQEIDDYWLITTNTLSSTGTPRISVRPQGDYFLLGAETSSQGADGLIKCDPVTKTYTHIGRADTHWVANYQWAPNGSVCYIQEGRDAIRTYHDGESQIRTDNVLQYLGAYGTPYNFDIYWNTTWPYAMVAFNTKVVQVNLSDYSDYTEVLSQTWLQAYYLDFTHDGTERAVLASGSGGFLYEWDGITWTQLAANYWGLGPDGCWDYQGKTCWVANRNNPYHLAKVAYTNTPQVTLDTIPGGVSEGYHNFTGSCTRDRDFGHPNAIDITDIWLRVYNDTAGIDTGWLNVTNMTCLGGGIGDCWANVSLWPFPEGPVNASLLAYNGIYFSRYSDIAFNLNLPPAASNASYNGNESLDGATLNGTVDINGTLDNSQGNTSVYWAIDNETWHNATVDELNETWNFTIDTTQYSNGEHQLAIRTVEDGQTDTQTYTVFFDNAEEPEEPTPTGPPPSDDGVTAAPAAEGLPAAYFAVPLGIAFFIAIIIFLAGRGSTGGRRRRRRGGAYLLMPLAVMLMLALAVTPAPAHAEPNSVQHIWDSSVEFTTGWNDIMAVDISPTGDTGLVYWYNYSTDIAEYNVWNADTDELTVAYQGSARFPDDTVWVSDDEVWIIQEWGTSCVWINTTTGIGGPFEYPARPGAFLKYAVEYYTPEYQPARERVWSVRSNSPQFIGYNNATDWAEYEWGGGIYYIDPRDVEINYNADMAYVVDGTWIEYWNASMDWDWTMVGDFPKVKDMALWFTHINDIEVQHLNDGSAYIWVAGGEPGIHRLHIDTDGYTVLAHNSFGFSNLPITNTYDIEIDKSGRFIAVVGFGGADEYIGYYDTQDTYDLRVPDEVGEYSNALYRVEWWDDREIQFQERWLVSANHNWASRWDIGNPYTTMVTPDASVFPDTTFYVNATFTEPYDKSIMGGLAVVDGTQPFAYWKSTGMWIDAPDDQYTATITGMSEGPHEIASYCYNTGSWYSAVKYIDVEVDLHLPPWHNMFYPMSQWINDTSRMIGGQYDGAISVEVKINDGDWQLAELHPPVDWTYIIPVGHSGTLDIYSRAYDGTWYSDVVHRQFILNTTGLPPEEPPAEPSEPSGIDVTVAGQDIVLETSQILMILTGITAFSALFGLILTSRRRRRK